MILYEMESDCVGCPQGCINCGRREKTPHLEDLVCDCCNRSVEKLFKYDGSQYCAECILEDFEEINEDNFLEYLGK